MRIADLTPDQIRRYFEFRFDASTFMSGKDEQLLRCPFHHDSNPSMSVNLGHGIWYCHAGCGSGGLLDFEERFSGCDRGVAKENILELLGMQVDQRDDREPDYVWNYVDPDGKLQFQTLRYNPEKPEEKKRISHRMLDPDGRWQYNLRPIKGVKPLYNLPSLITANYAFITEGEKCADRLTQVGLGSFDRSGNSRVAVTTNVDGAGKWRPEYGAYFAGKHVYIFPDNDSPGQKHAEQVATSVSQYAHDTHLVAMPGLDEGEDVFDYLQRHSARELLDVMQRAPVWKPPVTSLLVEAPEFLKHTELEIDWLVRDVIQRGSNGFIVSAPKVGKSWVSVMLAISVALGIDWIGFPVTKAAKVALITREDNPRLTRWRVRHLLRGIGREESELGGALWVNSRDQSPQFKIDNAAQLGEMVAALRQVQPELIILDVLNVMHAAEENDNTEMRKILDFVDVIHRETGASVAIVHHFSKVTEGRLTERMRGASAIAGWAEWVIGLALAKDKVKCMEFELKAAMPPDNVFFHIDTDKEAQCTRILRTEEPKGSAKGKNVYASRAANGPQVVKDQKPPEEPLPFPAEPESE